MDPNYSLHYNIDLLAYIESLPTNYILKIMIYDNDARLISSLSDHN